VRRDVPVRRDVHACGDAWTLVNQVLMYALAAVHEMRALSVVRLLAPPAADPATDPPDPPARDLRVEELGVLLEPWLERGQLAHEPLVSGVQVGLVDGPIAVGCYSVGIRRDRAPDIADSRRVVVHGLDLPGASWAQQQRRE
jgi:hypothetical protein